MASNPLRTTMESELKKWANSTRIYGGIHVTARTFLIIATGIVAAKENLAGSSVEFLVRAVPVLSLLVAIVTSLDTWLKPRDKWRGFMEDRDDLDDLLIRAPNSENASANPTDQLRTEFRELRKRHREKNVY